MKAKKIVAVVSVLVLLAFMAVAMCVAYIKVPGTYENTTDVKALLDDPKAYDTEGAEGIAEIIVKENLDKTNAMNDVASIVFDFRGFDTLGESFILLTAIAGTFVILSVKKKAKKEGSEK
ncbi:MAG: hypothetical protein E7233_10200 [Lachnospiraceae bacterium]|nr:hypothetical protein [Lachnospiraceae bacterium]